MPKHIVMDVADFSSLDENENVKFRKLAFYYIQSNIILDISTPIFLWQNCVFQNAIKKMFKYWNSLCRLIDSLH